MTDQYLVGDPVMDAAQGRAMVVVAVPDQTVAEWSDANNYDLPDNYANSRFSPSADEPVIECVYVSDIRSKPSKTYTFPASRCKLIEAHRADTGRRVYHRVTIDVLTAMLEAAPGRQSAMTLVDYAADAGMPADVVDELAEYAEAAHGVAE